MIAYPYGALYTGILLILTGVLTLVRHFLLEPSSVTFPRAPLFVRHAMFVFGCAVAFLGLQFLTVFMDTNAPNSVPPQPGPAIQFLSTILAIHETVMLVNVARQRYPAEVWARLNRMNEALPCKNRWFTAWLSRN